MTEPVKSTSKAEVVRVGKIDKLPNADSLGQTMIHGGYPVVVRLADWKEGDLGTYIPPDNLVPLNRPEFAWLKDRPESAKVKDGREYHRVRTIRLRKALSMGLLIPIPTPHPGEQFNPGDNLAPYLEILHYDPPQKGQQGAALGKREGEKPPWIKPPHYDLDSLRRYVECFKPGEMVYVTEKIHGANARYTWQDRGWFEKYPNAGWRFGLTYIPSLWHFIKSFGKAAAPGRLPGEARYLRVGSRNLWKRYNPNWKTLNEVDDIWWKAAFRTPEITEYLSRNKKSVIYAEVYGKVQELQYGLSDDVRLAVFDVLTTRGWMPAEEFRTTMRARYIPTTPLIKVLPFDFAEIEKLAEGPSLIPKANHTREGVVVKPAEERIERNVGRLALKLVGEGYYKLKE
jgi:RNA ligase (TIGR02306 family)